MMPRRIKTRVLAPAHTLNLSAAVPWVAIVGLIASVLGGLVANASGLLEYFYPLATSSVGVLLYWRYPTLYLGFTWWLWLLTPEVRRLVDYQQGWNPESPVMLAPYLVTAFTSFTLLRHLPKLQFYRYFAFGLILLGLFYSYGVGILSGGSTLAATFDLLNWLVPVVFAFHLLMHWRQYPQYRRVIRRTFVWSVLVIGLYGLLQFFRPPAWDQYWMINAPIASVGLPEPLGVRVFSTLNSPGPFAVVIMAGLLLLLSGGGPLRWPAAGVGYASFLLSAVRAAWGGWVVGLLFIIAQRSRLGPRLLTVLVVTGLITLPLLTVGPVSETINERLQTFTNLRQDTSFNDRVAFQLYILPQALLNPIGTGLGSTGIATKLSAATGELGELGVFDSGLLNIPYVLGWPGSLLYIGGLIWLLYYALHGVVEAKSDLFAVTSRGIAVAMLAQLFFVNTLIGVSGMVFWGFLGLALAAQVYYVQIVRTGDRRDNSSN